jgi:hypothetical protein
VALLLALGGAATARAAGGAGVPTGRPVAAGPVFAGQGLAWATWDRPVVESGGPYGFAVRRSASIRGGAVRVLGASSPGRDQARAPDLLSSGELLVAATTSLTTGDVQTGAQPVASPVRSWGVDGSLAATFGACASGALAPTLRPGATDLDGHEVVSCDADGAHLDVFDGRTGALIDQLPAARPVSARIAGPYVAWLEPAAAPDALDRFTLVAVDRRTRAEVLRVTSATLADGPLTAWDLGPDGVVAYAIGAPARLGWTSAAAPVPHAIPGGPAVRFGVLRLSGRTVVVSTLTSIGFDLRRIDLDGSGARLLARRAGRDFDLRDGRMAFSVPGCAQDVLRVRPLSGPAYVPAARTCALPVPARLAVHAGRVRLRVDCRALPFSCDGPLTLRRRSDGALLARGDLVAGVATITLRVTARRALAAHRSLRARLTATLPARYEGQPELVRRRDVLLGR